MSERDLMQHESPFENGYEACMNGETLKDCPYGRGDPRTIPWRNGWFEADKCIGAWLRLGQ